jgi:lipoprotein-anchoring transpeptidase ErfK/SrfK
LAVLERRRVRGQTWLRIEQDEWVRGQDVRSASSADPPAGLAPEERWIDIDVGEQVLTAYEGVTPVFTTLVSTGKGPDKSELATPRGEHRIWVKLRSADMDNLEDEEARRYYAIQEVPWVMYFARGYGLHGTFWHRSFGRRRSHGCVNLAPLDARWLFFWTSPHVPAGWTAALPTQVEPGTRVRVR